jgi:hypothetical protein
VGVLGLLDLDHAGKVGEFEHSAEVVEVVEGEGGVLGGEFDVVVEVGVANEFYQRGSDREEVGAEALLVGAEEFAQAVLAHWGGSLGAGALPWRGAYAAVLRRQGGGQGSRYDAGQRRQQRTGDPARHHQGNRVDYRVITKTCR